VTVLASGTRRVRLAGAGWLAAAGVAAPVEGVLAAARPALAAVIPALLLLILAGELPVGALLGAALTVRAIADDTSGHASRAVGSVNLSGAIAGFLLVLAMALLLRRQRAVRPIAAAAGFIMVTTAVALFHLGPSFGAAREGFRELSVLAVFVIVVESPRGLLLPRAIRLVQAIGIVPALVALYQLALHHGMQVHANLRPNGTFSQPNSAAVFFAIVAFASVWMYLEHGRHGRDLAAAAAFVIATIATYSIGGVATLLVMLVLLGITRPRRAGVRLAAWAIAGTAVAVFVLTPIGSSRIGTEANLSTTAGRDTSLTWRFANWGALLPLYEKSVVVGQGLGVTVTGDTTTGALPHNEWVRYLVETGTVGMAVIVAAIVLATRRLWRRRASHPAAAAFALALLFGLLLNGLGANTLLYTPAAYLAALLLAACYRSLHAGAHEAPG
jgi:O-antigen ligase